MKNSQDTSYTSGEKEPQRNPTRRTSSSSTAIAPAAAAVVASVAVHAAVIEEDQAVRCGVRRDRAIESSTVHGLRTKGWGETTSQFNVFGKFENAIDRKVRKTNRRGGRVSVVLGRSVGRISPVCSLEFCLFSRKRRRERRGFLFCLPRISLTDGRTNEERQTMQCKAG